MIDNSKPWYRSMTVWAGILLFYCGAMETYIAVWFPLLGAESVVLDRQEVITMALKTIPLLGSVIGLAGVILGRTRADTKLGFHNEE